MVTPLPILYVFLRTSMSISTANPTRLWTLLFTRIFFPYMWTQLVWQIPWKPSLVLITKKTNTIRTHNVFPLWIRTLLRTLPTRTRPIWTLTFNRPPTLSHQSTRCVRTFTSESVVFRTKIVSRNVSRTSEILSRRILYKVWEGAFTSFWILTYKTLDVSDTTPAFAFSMSLVYMDTRTLVLAFA